VAEVRKNTRRRDFTTEETDEVCSLGHPMVIRLGRNGRFLACSLYPEHKESRPLPGEEPEAPVLDGAGETCPECNIGTLVGKRGRFGPFLGCDRYPECGYIKRDGPPPPAQLSFEVECPRNHDGHLVARRARRTGNVFYGCSNYPKCDYTTNHEPVGAFHDADDGPVARKTGKDEGYLCLACGAEIEVPVGSGSEDLAGLRLAGGPPNPEAIAPKGRGGGGRPGGGRRTGGARAGAGSGGRRRATRSTRATSTT
jgi:ssDNA-binding Zn-finger/Zn-ribbon topoisomerase 1